jgi:surface-adhesin protein E
MNTILRVILVASAVMSAVAVADDVVPTLWKPSFHRPAYNAMYVFPSSYLEGSAKRQVWHKIDFMAPQDSPRGQFTSRVVLLEIDCQGMTSAVKRDIEYRADGSILADSTIPDSALVHQKFTTKDLTESSADIVRRLALADSDIVCRGRD